MLSGTVPLRLCVQARQGFVLYGLLCSVWFVGWLLPAEIVHGLRSMNDNQNWHAKPTTGRSGGDLVFGYYGVWGVCWLARGVTARATRAVDNVICVQGGNQHSRRHTPTGTPTTQPYSHAGPAQPATACTASNPLRPSPPLTKPPTSPWPCAPLPSPAAAPHNAVAQVIRQVWIPFPATASSPVLVCLHAPTLSYCCLLLRYVVLPLPAAAALLPRSNRNVARARVSLLVQATAAPARPATPATADVDTTLTPKQLGFTMPGRPAGYPSNILTTLQL